jgi:hypothetical protein
VDSSAWLAVIAAFLGGGTIGAFFSAWYARTQDFRERMLLAADEFMVAYTGAEETLIEAMDVARRQGRARKAAEEQIEKATELVTHLQEAAQAAPGDGTGVQRSEELKVALNAVALSVRRMGRARVAGREEEYESRRTAVHEALATLDETEWFSRSPEGAAIIELVERADELGEFVLRRRRLRELADAKTYELTGRVARLLILFAGGEGEKDVTAAAGEASKEVIRGFQALVEPSMTMDERVEKAGEQLKSGSTSAGVFARRVNSRVRRHFL